MTASESAVVTVGPCSSAGHCLLAARHRALHGLQVITLVPLPGLEKTASPARQLQLGGGRTEGITTLCSPGWNPWSPHSAPFFSKSRDGWKTMLGRELFFSSFFAFVELQWEQRPEIIKPYKAEQYFFPFNIQSRLLGSCHFQLSYYPLVAKDLQRDGCDFQFSW